MSSTSKLPDNYMPALRMSPRVGEQTRDWWQAIGQSLMQFTEVEQLVLDWAVRFSGDRSLWKNKFMADLKALVPVLNSSLKKAGYHRLSPEVKGQITRALADLDALNQPRNDVAHMRLLFKSVPLRDSNGFIPSASHVQVRKRDDKRFVLAHRDLNWIRSTTAAVKDAGRSFQAAMLNAWREIHSTP
jgi:hypothetical protein